MRAMILAAGLGKRLRPLTYIAPKPLLPIGGVPMIVHQIRALERAGVHEFVINTAYQSAYLEAVLPSYLPSGVRVSFSREGTDETQALETLGGILAARPYLGDDPFIVVAGDILTDYPYERLVNIGRALNTERLAHLVLVENPAYHRSGDMALDSQERVYPKAARPQLPAWTFSSLGVYHPALFENEAPRVAKLFPWLFDKAGEKITGEVYSGYWANVGDPNEWQAAERHFAKWGSLEERVSYA